LNAATKEKRANASPEHAGVAEQRSVPALFVVDGALRVLQYREDVTERRKECRFDPATLRLPPAVERAVKELLERIDPADPSRVPAAMANGSLLVRLMMLTGGETPLFAVTVERFKVRASLRAVAARYALSQREHETLALVVKGAKNSEIASRLQISHSTAIFHVKRLMTKTGARNRTELVAKVVG
jgi:DNA-binding CsgD family transcriptional regulator